jgi:hypothetical protein
MAEGLTSWFLDTSYGALRDSITTTADAVIVVFSVHRSESLTRAKTLVKRFRRHRIENHLTHVPVALIANRTSAEELSDSGERIATTDQVAALRTAGYEIIHECSARYDEATVIESIFVDVGKAILALEQLQRDRYTARDVVSKRRASWATRVRKSTCWSSVGMRRRPAVT